MRLLLDSHVLVWWLADSPELGMPARQLIEAPENLVCVSAASVWELRIKEALGKIDLPSDFEQALDAQAFERLPVHAHHAHALRGLPMIHRDPFDRLLIVQAKVDSLTLLTRDPIIRDYPVEVVIV